MIQKNLKEEFIAKQLILLARIIDYSDEVGRRKMIFILCLFNLFIIYNF